MALSKQRIESALDQLKDQAFWAKDNGYEALAFGYEAGIKALEKELEDQKVAYAFSG